MEQRSNKRWTVSERNTLLKLGNKPSERAFVSISKQLNRSVSAIKQHYALMNKPAKEPVTVTIPNIEDATTVTTRKKWTEQEEKILIDYLRANAGNFSQAFLLASEKLGRSSRAVAQHWYTKLVNKEDVKVLLTSSPTFILRNKKHGKGAPCPESLFERLCNVVKRFFS